MENKQPLDSDEIDLLEVIAILMDGKFVLAGFVAAALTIAGLVVSQRTDSYATKAFYWIDLAPPFVDEDEIRLDILRTFFEEETFSKWKAKSPNSSLKFDLIDQKQIIGGASFRRDVGTRLVLITPNL